MTRQGYGWVAVIALSSAIWILGTWWFWPPIEPEPFVGPVQSLTMPQLEWDDDPTADLIVTMSEDYRDFSFSDNWPDENRICVSQGCLTFEQIRALMRGESIEVTAGDLTMRYGMTRLDGFLP